MQRPSDMTESQWKAFCLAAEEESVHATIDSEEDVIPWLNLWRAGFDFGQKEST